MCFDINKLHFCLDGYASSRGRAQEGCVHFPSTFCPNIEVSAVQRCGWVAGWTRFPRLKRVRSSQLFAHKAKMLPESLLSVANKDCSILQLRFDSKSHQLKQSFTKPCETVYPMAKNPIIIYCWSHSDLFTFFKRVIQESTTKAAKAQYRWVCPTTRYSLITWPSTPPIMGNLNFSTVGGHLGVIHRGKMMINQIRWEWECIGFQTMDSSVVPPKLMVDWWLIFG